MIYNLFLFIDQFLEMENHTTLKIKQRKGIKLEKYQVQHYKKIVEILKNEIAYLDVSTQGAGKTHISFAIAATFKLKLLVICPKSTISNWKKWSKYYGLKILKIMSYQSLRGMKDKPLNHDLLTKEGDKYIGSEEFDEYIKKGILLVFDECQMVKNENTQLYSAHALVKSVIRIVKTNHPVGRKSRIAVLSATPSVTKEQVISVFKILGIITSDKLYNYNRSNKNYELLGLQEAIYKCNRFDPDMTYYSTCRPINKTTVKTIVLKSVAIKA